jgi:hypothetical protein
MRTRTRRALKIRRIRNHELLTNLNTKPPKTATMIIDCCESERSAASDFRDHSSSKR